MRAHSGHEPPIPPRPRFRQVRIRHCPSVEFVIERLQLPSHRCRCRRGQSVYRLLEQSAGVAAAAATRQRHPHARKCCHLTPSGQRLRDCPWPQALPGPVARCSELDPADLVLRAPVQAGHVRHVVPYRFGDTAPPENTRSRTRHQALFSSEDACSRRYMCQLHDNSRGTTDARPISYTHSGPVH
jgi:hypothetical protein